MPAVPKPAPDNPLYRAALLTAAGTTYQLYNTTTSLNLSEPKGTVAQKATVKLVNTQYEGKWLTSIVKNRDRLFVYYDIGEGFQEIFRGFVWDVGYTSALQKELTLTAFDNLIYLQQSQDSLFFPADRTTQSVLSEICQKWGIDLSYSYASITHPKLLLKGKLTDIILSDLLEEVKKQTGKKFALRSAEDKISIFEAGNNGTVYEVSAKKNAIKTTSKKSMSGMVTQVVITGKEDDEGRRPIEATLSRNTDKYGTLQKIVSKSSGTDLSEVQKEANITLDEHAEPEETLTAEFVDNPRVRRGDKVKLAAGNLVGHYLVIGISRECDNKTATLDLEKL